MLKDIIQKYYSLDMFVQNDYHEIKKDSLYNFLWIGRGYPYRWLTFTSVISNDYLTINDAWKGIEANFKSTIPQVNLLKILRSEERIIINEKPIRVMRGVYEHHESDTGGPFVIYLFDGDSENEVILVAGFVNNPGREKATLLRQLELTIQKMKFN